MPTYTVIITTHNRPRLLPRAILSVKNQIDVSTQVIVVGDQTCSETYTAASTLLGEQDIFVQRSGLPGPAASRNLGLEIAKGENIVFLDDDDALSPEYLKKATPFIDGKTVLFTNYFVLVESIEEQGCVTLGGERHDLSLRRIEDIYVKNFIPPACLVYPRATVAGKYFDPSLVLNEDWDFILQVMRDAQMRHIDVDGPIVFTRAAADNRGRKNDHLLVETYLKIYGARPAPTLEQKRARQIFFESVGISVDINGL